MSKTIAITDLYALANYMREHADWSCPQHTEPDCADGTWSAEAKADNAGWSAWHEAADWLRYMADDGGFDAFIAANML